MSPRFLLWLAWLVFALFGGALDARAQSKALVQFEEKLRELDLEQSQRHLEYGLELRKQGMTAQAAQQIVLAAEVGRGLNPGATTVLSIMRQYDAAFWKRFGDKPSPGKAAAYERRARALELDGQRERLKLANWAESRELIEQSDGLYRRLLELADGALEFDGQGRLILAAGTIPPEPSSRIKESAITINSRLYLRDELLAKLQGLDKIVEVSDDVLRVRTTMDDAATRELHAMGAALVPELTRVLGVGLRERLALFVFATRAEYEAALDAIGLGERRIVTGVASPRPRVALVCAEGLEPEILRGVCLHELTHQYVQITSRSVFPGWFHEGFAETYGGGGTYTWIDGKLTFGGKLPEFRLAPMRAADGCIPLREFLAADPFERWRAGHEQGLRYYAQAWAFVRYLREGAGDAIALRFEQWQMRCMGQALGYGGAGERSEPKTAAHELFLEMFAEDLDRLDAGFRAFAREL